MSKRAHRWIGGAAAAVLIAGVIAGLAASTSAWGAGLASTEWPMFHRDISHTGKAGLPGPPLPETRWWQGGAGVDLYEAAHLPHGPQGAIWSSAATSEVSEEVPGAKKVWYFHNNSWTGRTALMLRSEFPEDAATEVSISPAPAEVIFETSSSMQFVGAVGDTLNTLVYRNQDPNSNLVFVKQADNTFLRKMRLPAGFWTFDFWVTNVPAATDITFTVYRFAHSTPDTRIALAGLDPVTVPLSETPTGALRRIRTTLRVTEDLLLEPDDGIAIGVSTAAGGSAGLVVEGRTASRVETPLDVPAIYAGSDDGAVYAFDATTGNVLWSYAVADTWFRSSPAVGDDGSIYIGSYEGATRSQGRLYAFNRDGTVKWTYPAVEQFAYFRSGYLPPDVAADFPPDTAPLYFFPGDGTDPNPATLAETGTQTGSYVQFVPRTTNAAAVGSPPVSLTQAGWLLEINPAAQATTLQPGVWALDLALRSGGSNTSAASGLVTYRISKVRVVAGTPPTVVLVEELLGWTQDTQQLSLLPGQRVFAHIETPSIHAADFAQGDYIFVELMIRQTVSTGSGSGGWELLLEGNDSAGGSPSRLSTPALSEAALDAISASPAISGDGVVYIGTHGGEVHAVEADSGHARWVSTPREADLASELRSSPAIGPDGAVYVGSMNGRLYALNGNDGEILWRFPVSADPAVGSIESSPALDVNRDVIYFGSNDGNLYCVEPVLTAPDEITPQLQWTFATTGRVLATPAIGSDGTVYVGSLDHNMYAVNPDGTPVGGLWPYLAAGEIQSSAAIAAPGGFYFVNELLAANTFHFSTSPSGDIDGDEGPRVISLGLSTGTPEAAFTQEFQTRPQAQESKMPERLPAGRYTMQFWARAALPTPGDQAWITFNLFHVTAAGTETPILSFVQEVASSTSPAQYRTQVQLGSDVVFAPDDHMRVEIRGRVILSAPDTTGVVLFYFDGNTVSQLTGPTLIYFASSVLRIADPPQVVPEGRVYCLDETGTAVWVDPNDGLAGYNPRGGDPLSFLTAFTASPAIWEIESTRIVTEAGGQVTEIARRLDPVVYLGGQDSVMYAFGPAGEFAPPPVLPPPVIGPSALTLTKQADKAVADIGQQINYSLRYRNESGLLALPATGVVIEDPLPDGVDFVSASDGGQDIAGIITWTAAGKPELAAIWPQDSGEVSFTVQVRADVSIIPPLGEEAPPEYPQPFVYVTRTDPVSQGVTQPLHPWDPQAFSWGDMLYIFLIGRGKPAEIINSSDAGPAVIAAVSGEVGVAPPVTVYAGWGKRYRLTFAYSPANDPDPMTPPDNQPVIYTTELTLTAADRRSGRPEEAYEYEDAANYPDPRAEYIGEALGLTVFKVQLSPRGYPYSPTTVSVTEPPNRPWTPYYWRAVVQQNRGGGPGREEWGPEWLAQDEGTGEPYGDFDFIIHEPLEVMPATYALAGGAAVNPGTKTHNTSFTIANVSSQSFTGTGPVNPRNVVRWDKVDLAQSGPPYDNPDPAYQFRDENYLPENRIAMGSGQLRLGPGQRDNVSTWVDVPAYLSPGTYQAPNVSPQDPTSEMLIYIDLNGNGTWDPGETKFENEYDYDDSGNLVQGDFGPFEIAALLWLQPWVRFGSETVDVGKVPAGAPGAPPPPALQSLGNVDLVAPLSAVTLDSNYTDPDTGLPSPLLPVQRSDLSSIHLYDWRETQPWWWDVSGLSAEIYKTPVGAVRPNQQWLLLGNPPVGSDQPTGAYSGAPDAVSAVSGVVTRASSSFAVRVVERRLTGYDWSTQQPVLGADIDPWAAWVDDNTLRVFWSSNRRADGAEPTASDPYLLWYDSLDRAADTWSGSASYPAAGGDPMDLPPASPPTWYDWVTKQHLTPAHGVDADGTEWLFWGASDLRPNDSGGHFYDNRLLWTSGWPLPTSADAIEDEPAVAGPTGSTANASDTFRLQPRPVFWDDGVNEYNYVVLSEHSASQPSGLWVRYRSRPLSGSWSAWSEQSLPTSSGLTASRDPSAFEYDGYLWVAFSGASEYHRSYDLYLARYDPGALTPVAFAQVTGAALTPNAAHTTFASRDPEWVVAARADLAIYVGGVEIGGALGALDPATGRYPITGGTFDVEFDPALGTVYFTADPGAAVSADYTPRLLRLTTHPADESNPSAFMETYRYLDSGGDPQPAGYAPRLWVFWAQEGMIGSGAQINYVTLRETAPEQWSAERPPQWVAVDHAANEFGLCAVKDPLYAQVWLLWSSTRGAPTGGDPAAAADSDVYYQVFNPELP